MRILFSLCRYSERYLSSFYIEGAGVSRYIRADKFTPVFIIQNPLVDRDYIESSMLNDLT